MSVRNFILEDLNQYREDDRFFESLKGYSNLDLSVNESVGISSFESIDENTVVTFDGQMFPKFGYACVYSGAPGSGKGYVGSTKLAIQGKTLDVDRLKELYIKAQKYGKINDPKQYDLNNPDDVSILHQRVKDLGLKDKQEEAFFNEFNKQSLPNVIFDITGDDPNKLEKLGKKLKEMGYKTTLVWVITNRQVAMIQNLSRERIVSQKIFHEIHNAVAKNVFPFFKTRAKDYDEAWLVFNSEDAVKQLSAEGRKCIGNIGTVKLEKKGKGFVIPNDIAIMIYNILGPIEGDPEHPQVYKDFNDVKATHDLSSKKASRQAAENIEKGLDTLLKKVE